MKYEELIAKIDKLPEVLGLAEFKMRHDALRAVVEYHKPYESKNYGLLCSGCDEDPTYPCGTIQVIEQELA
jgi:hypothetical protein